MMYATVSQNLRLANLFLAQGEKLKYFKHTFSRFESWKLSETNICISFIGDCNIPGNATLVYDINFVGIYSGNRALPGK